MKARYLTLVLLLAGAAQGALAQDQEHDRNDRGGGGWSYRGMREHQGQPPAPQAPPQAPAGPPPQAQHAPDARGPQGPPQAQHQGPPQEWRRNDRGGPGWSPQGGAAPSPRPDDQRFRDRGRPDGERHEGDRRDRDRPDWDRRDWDRRDRDHRDFDRRDWDRDHRQDDRWRGDRPPSDQWRDGRRPDFDRGRHEGPRWAPHAYPPIYRSPQRYRGYEWRPRYGYYYRAWRFGEFLPRDWYAPDYWIEDWWDYGLPEPPPGLEWVRVGTDALLIDEDDGRILQVVCFVFW